MDATKSALGSMTIISGGVVVAANLAQLFGYSVSPSDAAAATNLINSGFTAIVTIVSIGAGLLSIYGRIKATKQVTSILPTAQSTPLPPKSSA